MTDTNTNMTSNKKYYHYEITDNENKTHYFSTIKDVENHFGKISKRYFYSLLTPEKEFSTVKKDKTKNDKIVNIKKVKMPRMNYYNDNNIFNTNNNIYLH